MIALRRWRRNRWHIGKLRALHASPIRDKRRTDTERSMFKASAGVMLPTSIIGSLPRPTWYTAMLGLDRSFLEAMVNSRYREQYEDAVSCLPARAGNGRSRHRHRRRRALRRAGRRHELAELSADAHGGIFQGGRARRSTRSAPSPIRAGISCTIFSRRACSRRSSGRSAAATCNTRRCGRSRSA